MKQGLKKLYSSDFNFMSQETLPDGSRIVIISKHGENKHYKFRVKDLYGENEEVTEHQVIPSIMPQWLIDRRREAKKHNATGQPIT